MTPEATVNQINRLIRYLVETSLADDQQFAFLRESQVAEITFGRSIDLSGALGKVSYSETYENFIRDRAFNVKLLDGALIQMLYMFADGELRQHRLAFLPAPHLEGFERETNSYIEDRIYAEIVARDILPLPVRFDYDARDGRHQDIAHPKSHLTLGEYADCRIPVTAPLTPSRFVDFVLRNFYRTRRGDFTAHLPIFVDSFPESITPAERSVLHMAVPLGRRDSGP